MKIRTLADIKRAIQIPGVTMRVLNHWQPLLNGTTRTPSRVQTNGYYFEGLNRDGKSVQMWADIPKASQLRFNEDGSVTFYPDTDRSWTLAFDVPETTAQASA